jgi:hypothetical protein
MMWVRNLVCLTGGRTEAGDVGENRVPWGGGGSVDVTGDSSTMQGVTCRSVVI